MRKTKKKLVYSSSDDKWIKKIKKNYNKKTLKQQDVKDRFKDLFVDQKPCKSGY